MADGFHIKDIDKLYQICCQFLGNKTTIRKTNYKHKIELSGCFLSGKNEEESQCSACKINTLKAYISPSYHLPTLHAVIA